MSMLDDALAIIGQRNSASSRELVAKLMPNWRTEHGTMQRAGYVLAKALGVSPIHGEIAGRYRSLYLRADLEAKRGEAQPEPTPLRVVEPAAKPADRTTTPGLTRCRACRANNMEGEASCWECGAVLQP